MSSVLYDVPGPKARRVSLIGSIVGVVAIAGLLWWAISILAQQGIFEARTLGRLPDSRRLGADRQRHRRHAHRRGGRRGHRLPAGPASCACMRISDVAWIRIPTRIVLEFLRGMPVVLMMFFVLLVFATGSFVAVVAGLVLYNSAIFAEIIRAGIQSLPKGQREAGLAIGLTSFASRRSIELPQAIRRMLPSLVAQLVVLLKDTSLGYIVSYEELLRKVQIMADFLGPDYLFPVFFVAAAIYIAINFSVSRLAIWIEKRGSKKAAGGVVHVPVAGIPVK